MFHVQQSPTLTALWSGPAGTGAHLVPFVGAGSVVVWNTPHEPTAKRNLQTVR